MATGAGTKADGSEIFSQLNGFSLHAFQVDTQAAGEDGTTINTFIDRIRNVQVSSNEDTKTGGFSASWSGSTITVKSLADTGDAATVSVLVLGN